MVKRNHLVRHPFWPNEFDLRRERSLTQRPFGNRQIAIMKNSAGLRKKAGIDYQHDQEHEQDSLTPAEPTRLEPRATAERSPTARKIASKRQWRNPREQRRISLD